MPSMSEIIAEHTELSDSDQRWLKLLVSEWQLLADLSLLRPGALGARP